MRTRRALVLGVLGGVLMTVCTSARADITVGGLIATDDEETLRALQALVVVYEGLHTYGGQAGRGLQSPALSPRSPPGCAQLRRSVDK